MKNCIRCNSCGYDLYGHEYLTNTLDADLYSGSIHYTNNAILNVCTKDAANVTCPFCHTTGEWSLS